MQSQDTWLDVIIFVLMSEGNKQQMGAPTSPLLFFSLVFCASTTTRSRVDGFRLDTIAEESGSPNARGEEGVQALADREFQLRRPPADV